MKRSLQTVAKKNNKREKCLVAAVSVFLISQKERRSGWSYVSITHSQGGTLLRIILESKHHLWYTSLLKMNHVEQKVLVAELFYAYFTDAQEQQK